MGSRLGKRCDIGLTGILCVHQNSEGTNFGELPKGNETLIFGPRNGSTPGERGPRPESEEKSRGVYGSRGDEVPETCTGWKSDPIKETVVEGIYSGTGSLVRIPFV